MIACVSPTSLTPCLLERFQGMFGCDSVRISGPHGASPTLFLVLGWRENTSNGRTGAHWTQDGTLENFDYIREETVAAGVDEAALIASAERYKRLLGMTMIEYMELVGKGGIA